jgi:hypothetical protein
MSIAVAFPGIRSRIYVWFNSAVILPVLLILETVPE